MVHATLVLGLSSFVPAPKTATTEFHFASVELIELEPEPRPLPPAKSTPTRVSQAPLAKPAPDTARPRRAPRQEPPSSYRPAAHPPPSRPHDAGRDPHALELGPRAPTVGGRPRGPAGEALITRDAQFLRTLPAQAQRLEGPTTPVADDPRAGIVELANGNLGYSDPSGNFNAFIKPDGSVTFLDSKNVAVKACVAFVCIGGGEVRPLTSGGKEKHHTLGVDFALVPLGIGGVMGRRVGTNRRETIFLKRTFDLRMDMSLRWQRRQMATQLRAMREQLEAAWLNPRYPTPESKRELFRQLWRECDADPSPLPASLDGLPARLLAARRTAAREAREQIEAFYLGRTGEALW